MVEEFSDDQLAQEQKGKSGSEAQRIECAWGARRLGQRGWTVPGLGAYSVKTEAEDGFGQKTAVLCITPLGSDLRTARAGGLVGFGLERLRQIAAGKSRLPQQQAMELAQLDPRQARACLDALWHSLLPGPYVLFAHPPELLALLACADGRRRCAELFGDAPLFVEQGPADALGQRVQEALDGQPSQEKPPATAVFIGGRGVAVHGNSAAECHRQMAALVAKAREHLVARVEAVHAAELGHELDEVRRSVALVARGAMQRATGQRWIARWRSDPRALRASVREDVLACLQRGPAAQDLFVAGSFPLIIADLAGGDPLLLGTALDEELQRYRQRVLQRFGGDERLAAPRVIVCPGAGLLCLAPELAEAETVAQAFEFSFRAAEAAEALGGFQAATAPSVWADATPPRGRLEGMVVLVTGAASGIGLATSRAMLQEGAHVLISDRDARVLDAVSEWPSQRYPGRVAWRVCDVTDEAQCRAAVEAACEQFGGLDIVVSNAGVAPSGLLHDAGGDAALRKSVDVNLLGHQRIARAAAEVMLAQASGGVLLFNASRTALHQGPLYGPYAVPKAALIALMRQYAIDLGPRGIRSNAVNADRIRTKLFAAGMVGPDAMSPSEYFRANLLGKETTPEHVAEAFVYLATAEATTGCILTVDGGNPAAFPR